jgi:hypothetical protein
VTLSSVPRGVWTCAGFFFVSGIGEIVLSLHDAARPLTFDTVWQALGRGILHLLVAWGLWRRVALCRSIAMVYCIAAVITYGVALALALGHAPLRVPPSVVLQSLYQVPSCVLLLPYLRSPEAASLFPRPLFGA